MFFLTGRSPIKDLFFSRFRIKLYTFRRVPMQKKTLLFLFLTACIFIFSYSAYSNETPFTGDTASPQNASIDTGTAASGEAHAAEKDNKYTPKWMIMLSLNTLGGLAVFLFGMALLNDALQNIAGSKMRQLLTKLTKSSGRGLLTGTFITCIIQSSSATTVMEVGLVSAGLLTFYQTLGITLGAEIGTTITAQLVAFKVSEYAMIITGVGFFTSLLARTKKVKYWGDAILGFGVLFLGMDMMSTVLHPLRSYEPFMNLMKSVENPIMGVLVGLVFTCIIQSSSATSGIVIAMAFAGTLNLEQAIPINMGAMIGTTITAVLASLNLSREAKRSAYIHTLFQLASVLITLPFLYIKTGGTPVYYTFVKWITHNIAGTDDMARQIAMSHTIIPIVINPLIHLPLLPLWNKLIHRIYPQREEEKPFGAIYLQESLMNTPFMALENAKKEVLREGEIVSGMLKDGFNCFFQKDNACCDQIRNTDTKVDTLNKAIEKYLINLAQQGLTDKDTRYEMKLLYISSIIEATGDIIEKNLMHLADKIIIKEMKLPDESWKNVREMHERVLANFTGALKSLADYDKNAARVIADQKQEIGKFEADLRKKHMKLLHQTKEEMMEVSAIYLDIIDQYKRINSQAASIAYAVLGEI